MKASAETGNAATSSTFAASSILLAGSGTRPRKEKTSSKDIFTCS